MSIYDYHHVTVMHIIMKATKSRAVNLIINLLLL